MPKVLPPCSIDGCDVTARAMTTLGQPGMCAAHEWRYRKHGDANTVTRNPYTDAYLDTGCDFEPSCLRCSLPMCRYDMTLGEVQRLERVIAARRRAGAR